MSNQHNIDTMHSDPWPAELGPMTIATQLSEDERRTMLQKVRAGELTEMEITIIAFRAVYPNSNYMRFRDEDLLRFASSFTGQPFLRNHDVWDIGARDGTISAGNLSGTDFHQHVRLTSQRGMEDYLQGRIDRFSIGWYYDAINCSICEASWMECNHWPGRKYKGPGKNDPEQLCELVFINPTGKETSAVNAPAVKGTRVLADDGSEITNLSHDLAALCELKLQHKKEKSQAADTPPAIAPATSSVAPALERETEPASTHQKDDMKTTVVEPTAQENQGAQVVAPPPVAPIIVASQPEESANSAQPAATQAKADELMVQLAAFLRQVQQAPAPEPVVVTAPEPQEENAWAKAQRTAAIDSMLQASRLSVESCAAVRAAITADTQPDHVALLIETQRKVEARFADNNVVVKLRPNVTDGRQVTVSGMQGPDEKYREAVFALLDNRRPKSQLKPLSGIREAYILGSGDWEMTGRFKPLEVSLANITSSSLPDMMSEWMNQRVVSLWQSYDQWYRMFCDIQQFSSLRDPHWIKIGGIGELSTVGEGSAYTEKEWSAASETSQWTKKGNWVGVTIEAIDRDMTGYIQQLPKVLTQGAWLTISKDFTRRLITANGAGYGYVMASDNKAIFHNDHANLGAGALTYATWESTRLAMARQTEQGTGEVLGGLCLPRYMMVPRHLETTAIALLATERTQGNGNNDITPLAVDGDSITERKDAARKMLVVNDFLGLRNDWFAFADPARFPLFGLGFRWGEAPEIFSVADPASGLMFSNDVMPIKIRWYYSLGAIDHRGMFYNRVG